MRTSGALILPFGSISEVYRIKSVSTFSDFNPSLGQSDYVTTTYNFYKANTHYYLASSQELEGDASFQIAWYLDQLNVGISEPTTLNVNLEVYPNPVANNLYIDIENVVTETASLELYDYTGKKVADFNAPKHSVVNSIILDFSSFENGIYILQLRTEIGSITKHVLVNR